MVKGMLKSSPREEIQRYYQGKFLSMVGSKGIRKGGVVLQVQNLAHAWRELPCSYTHHRRFWHVFKWAEWYSWGKFGSSATWIFCWDSAFCRVSADIFSTWGRAREGDSSSTGGSALVLTMSLFWNLLLDQKFLRRDPWLAFSGGLVCWSQGLG